MDNTRINYIEMPAKDIGLTKQFFSEAFGWSFIDYGPDYIAIEGAGIDGGFYRSELCAKTSNGSVLLVLYSSKLEQILEKLRGMGAEIIQDIFDFPGGRRFHFLDPNGNEFAVWSEQ